MVVVGGDYNKAIFVSTRFSEQSSDGRGGHGGVRADGGRTTCALARVVAADRPVPSIPRPQRPDLDPTEAGHGMLRRDLDGLIESGALEQVEPGNPFLCFREGAVGDEEAPGAHPDRLRGGQTGQTVTDDSPTTLVVGGDPFLDVVLGRIEGLAGGIGADEHNIAHGNSFPGGSSSVSRMATGGIDDRAHRGTRRARGSTLRRDPGTTKNDDDGAALSARDSGHSGRSSSNGWSSSRSKPERHPVRGSLNFGHTRSGNCSCSLDSRPNPLTFLLGPPARRRSSAGRAGGS